ncbi:MAG: hypothetical protein ABSF61_02655 [Anaerolineales bacterium]|jgi:protein-S-isoprenylcysteine O-methyltransferase Ste14
MCVFCAAVPATVAVGANLNAKQEKARRDAIAEGKDPSFEKPIVKATLVVVVLLAVCSVIYHILLFPILRV